MKLFYHVVGRNNADRDFPKTVFSNIDLKTVADNMPMDTPRRDEILGDLQREFPENTFNCWGVPKGAESIMKNLKVGDVVLLVESVGKEGMVEALCQVKVFYAEPLWELSKVLWGESGYPYIFFFNTESLDLTWLKLRELLDYDENYNPRARFLSVSKEKPKSFTNHEDFVNWIRTNYAKSRENAMEQHASYELLHYGEKLETSDETQIHEPTQEYQSNPEVGDFIEETEVITGKRQAGQDFLSNQAKRRAIEQYAMKLAKECYEADKWKVSDVSSKESYDLLCMQEGQVDLHVEVKGTQSNGSSIILTRNEVIHANNNGYQVALFWVANIKVTENEDGSFTASGGDTHIEQPWYIDNDALTPISYEYKLSKGKGSEYNR